MESAHTGPRSSLEAQWYEWQGREARAAKALAQAGLFDEVDGRLLADDAVLMPPKFLAFSSLADRSLKNARTVGLAVSELRDRRFAERTPAQVLQAEAERGQPASLALLAMAGRSGILRVLDENVGRRLIVPGTGLFMEGLDGRPPSVEHVIIDRVYPSDHDDEARVRTFLRAVSMPLDQLRDVGARAVFVRP